MFVRHTEQLLSSRWSRLQKMLWIKDAGGTPAPRSWRREVETTATPVSNMGPGTSRLAISPQTRASARSHFPHFPEKRTYSFEFRSEQSNRGSVFSVQCSVFSTEKTRCAAAGCRPCESEFAGTPPVDWSLDPLQCVFWVGLDGSTVGKRVSAQLCTFPNMPTQANTIPAHAGTSPNMPAHACTTVESRLLERTSRCTDGTYIVGYAPASLS